MVTQNRAIKKNFNSTHNLAPLFESKSEINSIKNNLLCYGKVTKFFRLT